MKLNIYSIKDTKIGYMSPLYLQNDGVAVREFSNLAQKKEPNIINTNAEDKELWLLGHFEDQTGEILSEIRFIAKATDYVIKEV